MEWILGHWLSFAAGIFLLAMVLYGHYRGCVRIAVALARLVVNVVLVRLATPYIILYLKGHTKIPQLLKNAIINGVGLEEKLAGIQMPAQQRAAIEQLKLPGQIRDLLLENNNKEVYHILGVDTFLDYMGTYLTDMALNLIGSALLFILVYFLLRMVSRWLNLMARLPILSGINQIAGALLGGVQGLLWLWGGCVLVDVCSHMPWAVAALQQIQSSVWLSYLYHNNMINWLFRNILQSLL